MKIDILSKSAEDITTQKVAEAIREAAKIVNVKIEIQFTGDFTAFPGQSFNPVMTPIVFIQGKVTFSGEVPPMLAIQRKLVDLKEKGVDSSNWV